MMVDGGQPELPYAGSSGWSGSDTSKERADEADTSGTTSKRQADVLRILGVYGDRGITWFELAKLWNTHHGSASGVLSVLHKTGRICRLTDRRGRSKVYVLPGHVAGRVTEPYRANKAGPVVQARGMLHRLIEEGGADISDLEGLLAILEGDG